MGAVDQRQPLAIDLFEAAHDVGRDLLRRVGNAELVVHVARPLDGAHAHHLGLRPIVPPAASLLHQLLAHLVPHLLAVQQDSVEVENDRLDHALT